MAFPQKIKENNLPKTLLFTLDFPPRFGGVAAYYENFCYLFPPEKISVLTLPSQKEVKFPFACYRAPLLNRFIYPHWLPSFWHLGKIVRTKKISLVFVGEILPLGTVAWLLAKIFPYRYYVFLHGYDILNTQKKWRKKMLAKFILKQAQGVIANSEFTKKQALRLYPFLKEKIEVVYPQPQHQPPCQPEIKTVIEKKYNLKGKKILLSVGRFVERKGFGDIIEAYKIIKKDFPSVVCFFAGGAGPYLPTLEKIIKKEKLEKNIFLLPNLSAEELKALYDLCAIFVLPTRPLKNDVEGFGIVYLEANLFGRPAIAARAGGAEEAVLEGKTGLLVPPAAPKKLAKKIKFLLENPDLAQLYGKQGKERAEKYFSRAKQKEKIYQLISAYGE